MKDWQRQAFIGLVESFIGTRYEYGGGHGGISSNWLPRTLDCSGLIVVAAQMCRLLGWARDGSSGSMWEDMKEAIIPQPGDLVFWYRAGALVDALNKEIFHVEVLVEQIEDSWMCCGARGSRGAVVRTAGFERPSADLAGFRQWTT